MIRTQTKREAPGTRVDLRGDTESLREAGAVVWLMTLLAVVMAIAPMPVSASAPAKNPRLPYVTIDHPHFITASQATVLFAGDLLIGVIDGKTAKAYPAAILAQHGVVQDQMADGPIAVTW